MEQTRGFSLTELLVAGALGTILLYVLITIYWYTRQNYLLEHAEATIENNANTAIYILSQSLRMAGFIGCNRLGVVVNKLDYSGVSYTVENSIHGSKGIGKRWQPALPVQLTNVKPDTDIVTVWYRQAVGLHIARDFALQKQPYDFGKMLLISSCNQAELLTVKCSDASQVSCSNYSLKVDKSKQQYEQAELAPFFVYAYYISQSTYPNSEGQKVYGLFRKSLIMPNAHAQELVPGIEDMKIFYGVKASNNDSIIFLSADQVKQWNKVRILKILLLVNSINNVLTQPQTYEFNGKLYRASDRIVRREWVTYVYLRERAAV